jgi:hypothetical protein
MEKVEKQTPADLFVMIPRVKQITRKKSETTFTLLKCANIPQFEGVLPTKEILQTHFATQRVKMEIAKRDKTEYIPQPLYLEIESGIFVELMKAINKKQPQFKSASDGHSICLTLGNNMPCCIMLPQQEAKEVCNEPLKEEE